MSTDSTTPTVWGWVDDVTWFQHVDGEPTTSRLHVCADEREAREAVAVDPDARVLIRAEGVTVAARGDGRA